MDITSAVLIPIVGNNKVYRSPRYLRPVYTFQQYSKWTGVPVRNISLFIRSGWKKLLFKNSGQ